MKTIFLYAAMLFLTTATSCFNAQKAYKSVVPGKAYMGWYMVTGNGHFFLLKQEGLFKKNIAFTLPNNLFHIYPVKPAPSFFSSTYNTVAGYKKSVLIVGRNDTLAYGQDVSICKAKMVFESLDHDYVQDALKKGEPIINKIKARGSNFSISAAWIEGFEPIKNMVLYANSSKDSIVVDSTQYRFRRH